MAAGDGAEWESRHHVRQYHVVRDGSLSRLDLTINYLDLPFCVSTSLMVFKRRRAADAFVGSNVSP
jgi:hypothetical protein